MPKRTSGLRTIAGLRDSWQTYFERKHVTAVDSKRMAEAALDARSLAELREAEDWARSGATEPLAVVAEKRKPKGKLETLRELTLRELGILGWRGYEK